MLKRRAWRPAIFWAILKRSQIINRLLAMLITIVFVSAVAVDTATVNAAERSVPFDVRCEVQPSIVGEGPEYIVAAVPGDCVGTYLGKSTWFSELTAYMDPVDPFSIPAPQHGNMVFTAADGSELFGYFEVMNVLNDRGGFDYWGRYWIYDGSNRFIGTIGSGYYSGNASSNLGFLNFGGEFVNP